MANSPGAPNRPAHNAPVLVIGLGRFGSSTAEQLVKQGREVLAIERPMLGSSVSWVELAPKLPVPVALAYCTDHPASETEAVPRLNSSTKSCV